MIKCVYETFKLCILIWSRNLKSHASLHGGGQGGGGAVNCSVRALDLEYLIENSRGGGGG